MDRTRAPFVVILGVTAVTQLAVICPPPQPNPIVGLVVPSKYPNET